jgi:hypothetical protein
MDPSPFYPYSPAAPKWRQLYECAILEADSNSLPDRIVQARRAIMDRAEEILTHSSSDEGHALNHALRTLHLLEEVAMREKRVA